MTPQLAAPKPKRSKQDDFRSKRDDGREKNEDAVRGVVGKGGRAGAINVNKFRISDPEQLKNVKKCNKTSKSCRRACTSMRAGCKGRHDGCRRNEVRGMHADVSDASR